MKMPLLFAVSGLALSLGTAFADSTDSFDTSQLPVSTTRGPVKKVVLPLPPTVDESAPVVQRPSTTDG
jgi:hypothetical protein